MASQLSSIAAILFSAVFFLMGNGLIGTLTPVRAHLEGFSDLAVGALGAWYFTGFVAGCFAGARLLSRVGHIRAFAVAAALSAAAILMQSVWPYPLAWLVLRGITGFCQAILYMALESWLNDRATNETRGQILSLYIAINLSALLLGQWLLLLAQPQSFELFSIAAALYCLCLMPIALTHLPPPQPQAPPRVNIVRIFTVSPVGATGCLTVGLANGAFWTLAPIYAQSLGFNRAELAFFMSVFIAGGALVQWPLGRVSDGMDRRWIIAAICTVASFCGLVLGLIGWALVRAPEIFFSIVFVLGASMLPLYSLSIAHANDRLPRSEFVEASAGLLMISTAMSIPGPLIAAFLISTAGPYSLFLFTALAHAAMAFYAFTRIRVREPAPAETREAFNPVPPGSPAVLPLDPRGPAQENTP
jgi:MFS family permease